jgi:hypothetical protein
MRCLVAATVMLALAASAVAAGEAKSAADPILKLLQPALDAAKASDELTDVKATAGPAPIRIGDDATALTVTLQWTSWELRSYPMTPAGVAAATEEAMKLPEARRLKVMKRTDTFGQVWAVPLADHPGAGIGLVGRIPPSPKCAGRAYYLGQGGGYAWYMRSAIEEAAPVQEALGLKGGQDLLAVAVNEMRDAPADKPVDHAYFIARAGARALPLLEKLIADKSPLGHTLINCLYVSKDAAVSRWLVRQAESKDPEVAAAARHVLEFEPRMEAAPLYSKWLAKTDGPEQTPGLVDKCWKTQATVPAKTLERLLANPNDERTYRALFELSRQAARRPVPKDILEAEKEVCQQIENLCFHYKFVRDKKNEWVKVPEGPQFDPKKIDAAVQAFTKSSDPEAAAVVALALAASYPFQFYTDGAELKPALVAILKGIPDGQALKVMNRLGCTAASPVTRQTLGSYALLCGWDLTPLAPPPPAP